MPPPRAAATMPGGSRRGHPGQALDASEEPGILPGSEREAVDGNAIADAEPLVSFR